MDCTLQHQQSMQLFCLLPPFLSLFCFFPVLFGVIITDSTFSFVPLRPSWTLFSFCKGLTFTRGKYLFSLASKFFKKMLLSHFLLFHVLVWLIILASFVTLRPLWTFFSFSSMFSAKGWTFSRGEYLFSLASKF